MLGRKQRNRLLSHISISSCQVLSYGCVKKISFSAVLTIKGACYLGTSFQNVTAAQSQRWIVFRELTTQHPSPAGHSAKYKFDIA
jgi:hypothetical protein